MENLPHGVGDLLSNDGVTRFSAFVLVDGIDSRHALAVDYDFTSLFTQ